MSAALPLQTVRRTLAYFDLFYFPLTKREIRRFAINRPLTEAEIDSALAQALHDGLIRRTQGFFSLPQKTDLPLRRADNYLNSARKIQNARFWLKLLAALPFVRALFIVNNAGYFNASADSDLDLALVAADGKIWLTRLLGNIIILVAGRRFSLKNKSRAICLSFFITPRGYNLSACAYPRDWHLAAWLGQFLALYDPTKQHAELLRANPWIRTLFPDLIAAETNPEWELRPNQSLKRLLEIVFSAHFWETLAEKWQRKILPKAITTAAVARPRDVILNAKILKLHVNDRREKINFAFNQKINHL